MSVHADEAESHLKGLNSLEKVRELISALGFSYADEPLPTRSLPTEVRSAIAPDSLRVIGRAASYPIIFVRKAKAEAGDPDRQLIRLERELIRKLPAEFQDASIILVAAPDFSRVHFVNAKRVGKRLILRRYIVGPDEKMRTAAERIACLKVDGKVSWDEVLTKVEEAFDREAVTEQFFKDFEGVFKKVKAELVKQVKDEHTAHQFLHALLNRLMFIYFVQRKGWLAEGDQEFIKTLWDTYRDGKFPKDSFYRDWLATLFFSAFNNKSGYENKGLPKEVVDAFKVAPFLNGGLFKERDFDGAGFKVTDDMFGRIFERLLNHYNFTVMEDTPFDQNIAVDPEMLGIVYESLVNTSELSDERAEAGIFYTPRVEVDFMCRRTLVEYLANHSTPKDGQASPSREDLYRFIFPEEGEEIVPQFDKGIRQELDKALVDVAVVDPACGSGAFLVGMMQVILELRRELARQAGKVVDEFTEKRRIIERSLYGVDVKGWAISVAQLRLWLTLIEVADDKKLDLMGMKAANEPLLPSLSFKLREGDSLVQEIAGTTIPIRLVRGDKRARHELGLSADLKRKITELRKLKTDFYFNRADISEEIVKRKELALYEAIVDEKISDLQEEVKKVRNARTSAFQDELMGIRETGETSDEKYAKHKKDEERKRETRIRELQAEIERLTEIKRLLPQKRQLFWSIEFAEIFAERGGFDIVIGNPPYVRQEKIADPCDLERDITPPVEEKRKYKEHLQQMVDDDWAKSAWRVEQRSDLYVYFYLRGLALLNPRGAFCYISSNSWLDVGYGKGLQEFMLKNGRIHAIYDNEVKRSFKRSDVNTIIAVLGPSGNGVKDSAEHIARFVMFKQPFESAVTSDVLLEADFATERKLIERTIDDKAIPYARVFPMTQGELYKAGLEVSEDEEEETPTRITVKEPFAGVYGGNKWGGKYFRAPDIYWKILEKGKGKLVRLGDIAEVRRGFTTGANEFFYLEPIGMSVAEVKELSEKNPDALVRVKNGAGWEGEIEVKFLKPVIKSPRECKRIVIDIKDLRYLVFMCHESKRALAGTRALSYIEWGEKQGYQKRPTCAARGKWYNLNRSAVSDALWTMTYRDRFFVPVNLKVHADARLYDIYLPSEIKWLVLASLNSLTTLLQLEMGARAYGGGGGPVDVKVYEVLELLVPHKSPASEEVISDLVVKASNREIQRIRDEYSLPDRRALDDIIFDILGLTKEERLEVYKAVVELVTNRLKKARSV